MAEDLIDARGRLYAATHDPFRAWEAYFLASQYGAWGIEMPDWVSTYLADVALRLVQIARAEPQGRKLLAAIAKALGVNDRRGRGSVFARRKAARRARELALDVQALRQKGHKLYKAVDYVAEIHHCSRSTVERAYHAVAAGGWVFPGGWEGHAPSERVNDY